MSFLASFSHPVQELICEVMEDYKVLEEFLYNLTEEDFSDKWAQVSFLPLSKWDTLQQLLLSVLQGLCVYQKLQQNF